MGKSATAKEWIGVSQVNADGSVEKMKSKQIVFLKKSACTSCPLRKKC